MAAVAWAFISLPCLITKFTIVSKALFNDHQSGKSFSRRLDLATFSTHVTVSEDGAVLINGLPLEPGQKVQVVIKTLAKQPDLEDPYPLRKLSKGIITWSPCAALQQKTGSVLGDCTGHPVLDMVGNGK